MSFSATALVEKSKGGDFVLEGKVNSKRLLLVKSKSKHSVHCQEHLTPLTRSTVTFPLT